MKRLCAIVLVLAACTEPAKPSPIRERVLPDATARGISGLARDSNGTFWGAEERGHRLVGFDLNTELALESRPALPISGVDERVDLESVAFIGTATVVFGTETRDDERRFDEVLAGTISSSGIRLKPLFRVDYEAWKTRASTNQGLEGLCSAGGKVIVAIETALLRDGKRYAPLGVYDLSSKSFTPRLLLLHSDKGKISALACRSLPNGNIEVVAIERHYAICLVIRFELSPDASPKPIYPEVIHDIGRERTAPPNYEGIEWLSADELLLISDNDSGGITSETRLAILRYAPR